MRRRPTAIYRVLDEDELLRSSWPEDDPGESGDDVWADEGRSAAPAPAAGAERDRVGGGRLGARQRIMCACAGALVLAVLVARAASVLLTSSAGSRAARQPGVADLPTSVDSRPAIAARPAGGAAGEGPGRGSVIGPAPGLPAAATPGRPIRSASAGRRSGTPVGLAAGPRHRSAGGRHSVAGAAVPAGRPGARPGLGGRAPGGGRSSRPVPAPAVRAGAPALDQEFGFER